MRQIALRDFRLQGAKALGKLTMAEIDAEIAAARKEAAPSRKMDVS